MMDRIKRIPIMLRRIRYYSQYVIWVSQYDKVFSLQALLIICNMAKHIDNRDIQDLNTISPLDNVQVYFTNVRNLITDMAKLIEKHKVNEYGILTIRIPKVSTVSVLDYLSYHDKHYYDANTCIPLLMQLTITLINQITGDNDELNRHYKLKYSEPLLRDSFTLLTYYYEHCTGCSKLKQF